MAGGRGWIRTSVRSRGQIYSLLPLATRPPFQQRSRAFSAGPLCKWAAPKTGCIVTRPKPLKPHSALGPAKGGAKGAFKGRKPAPKGRPQAHPDGGTPDGPHWLWGVHACLAALANPRRTVERVSATRNAAARLPAGLLHEVMEPDAIDAMLPAGAVHQGLAVRVLPLPDLDLEDSVLPAGLAPVVVLDQVTDPQNGGAIFRAAAAFGARAVIMQDRKSPPLTGVLAKAAAGALESVPAVRVVNIARTLEALAEGGYLTIALEGEAQADIAAAMADPRPVAVVLGAEGKGLRDLVAAKCERRARIPISPGMESLNVAAACAIALYEANRGRG
jgi:23S rRNA (guanosine2251-2'-O)-methyltransferase